MNALLMRQRGFTLMELVVSIAIAGVFVVFAGTLVRAPLDSYVAQSDRAKVLDAVGTGWPQIERDIHQAMPNSARARRQGNVWALEMLRVANSTRHTTSLNAADITLAGTFANLPHGPAFDGHVTVLNNATANPYQLNVVTTPVGRTFRLANNPADNAQDILTISPQFNFPLGASPKSYLYLVREPVTYLCDMRAGTIVRYSGYTMAAAHTSRDTATELNNAGATSEVVARNISACRFSAPLDARNATRGQTVTASMTATVGDESSTMTYQAALDFPQ